MIQDYDNKIKLSKSFNPLLLNYGVELEVSIKEFINSKNDSDSDIEDYSDKILKPFNKNNCIFKWDSSVPYGFEIVSHPYPIESHYEMWPKLLGLLEDNGFISYDAPCNGMHIHASKNNLTNLQISKIVNFIYNRDNFKLIRKIAQRHEKHQASFKHRRKWRDYRPYIYDRHTAVNICEHTVEFRLFRGTLNYKAFFKNLQFCDALISFCSPSLYSAKECLNWWNFINFVRQHKKRYDHLWSYCEEKGMTYIEDWNEYLAKKEKEKQEEVVEDSAGEKMVIV
jgi:hypothetical protein